MGKKGAGLKAQGAGGKNVKYESGRKAQGSRRRERNVKYKSGRKVQGARRKAQGAGHWVQGSRRGEI